MNIVDYIIIGILGVSVLFGLYRGFLVSLLSTGGCLVSLLLSFAAAPKLAALIQANPSFQRTLLTYTDATSRIGDLSTSLMKVSTLTKDKIGEIVDKANLPGALSGLLRTNLENQVFTGIDTVADYVSQTIVSSCINILCYVVSFIAIYLALILIFHLLDAVFHLPVLKQLNALFGGVFGLVRGFIFVYILFALLPAVQTVVPVQAVDDMIAASRLAPLFTGGSLVSAILNGHL